MSTPWVLALPLLPYTIPSNILSSSIFLHIPRIRNTIPFDPEESVCRVRAKAFSFAEKRKRSRLQQPPPPLSNHSGLVAVGNTEGDDTRTSRYPSARRGRRNHSLLPILWEQSARILFVRSQGRGGDQSARKREKKYPLFIVDAYPVQKEEMCSIF